ncbi:MAG: putative bifunctional diguanylate cyclase/phosphodiesterase [Gammaproteobacteria bacterium]
MNSTDNTLYQALWHSYFNNANDGVFVLSDTAEFFELNQRLRGWMGLAADAGNPPAPVPLSELVGAGRTLRVFREHLAAVQHGQAARFEIQIQPRRGTARWVDVNLTALNGSAITVGVLRDITERHQLQAALDQQANFDDLTGLSNRRSFMRHLERLLHSAKSGERTHALVYIDLDHFKIINDTCGHAVGDQFLAQLAETLRGHVRRSDVIARIGGDEFGVLLEDCILERAQLVAETLRGSVAQLRFTWEEKLFHTTASIGLTEITRHAPGAQILSYADAACYVAKDGGRNKVQLFFSSDECTRKRLEMDWVTRINEAFEHDRFRLYYQRIVPVTLGETTQDHCEVLLRMIDGHGNLIPPLEFIPAAEKYDLMPLIDRWVIRSLFANKAAEWRRQWQALGGIHGGASLQCAVNISGASIGDDQFLDFLLAEIAAHGVPPEVLCLEITETMAITNMDKARQFIQRVRGIGCRIALDDFGSGMSSFAYIKTLPLDYLKIDGSLIRNIATDISDLGIVEAVNTIGHLLGFKTVAEFVESDAIMAKLRGVGIDYAQGFSIHQPEPLDGDHAVRLLAVRR